MFIWKENPVWAINSVNTVYTLANTPLYIDDLWVDGAIYTSFSLVGNVLTLSDAPTVSIFVDYESGASNIPVTSTVTLGDMKTKIWDLLSQRATSINFWPDKLKSEIHNVSLDIWRGRKTNVLNQQTFRAWNLWFQEGRTTFRIKGGSILTEELTIGDNIAEMNTTNVLSAGYGLLGGDIINYTSKTATQIEGVTGVVSDHLVGDNFIQLYTLPTDFETVIGLRKVVTTTEGTNYYDIPLNDGTVHFEIIRKGTIVLIKVNALSNGDLVEVKYTKKLNELTDDTDICSFPDTYGLTVIATIVAGEMGYVKSLPNSDRVLNLGYTNLKSMYQYFTNETKVIKQKLSSKPYSFNSVRTWKIYR